MKIVVIGYGSMGRRRIRLVQRIYENAEIICVDSSDDRVKQAVGDGFVVYDSLEKALEEKPDRAFVCTSPGHHAELILKLVEAGIHTFTEINLVDTDYDRIIESAEKKQVKVFMSSTMLYDRQICAIKEQVLNAGCPLNYIYHIGQYLPDWHPWEDYKNYFISRKETNGCREILAIQLPWIVDTFGKIKSVTKISQKSTKLDIEFDDTVYLQIEHENGTLGTFVCDVVSRNAVTYLEVFGETLHLMWNGLPEGLKKYNIMKKRFEVIDSYESVEHLDGYADNIIEDEYMDEINAFFAWVDHGQMPRYMIEDDKYIISIINSIEEN